MDVKGSKAVKSQKHMGVDIVLCLGGVASWKTRQGGACHKKVRIM